MSSPRKLKLVLMWHMHQPEFRDQNTGEFLHPWVYLHALKDYSDMAAHLERHPGVKAVINLVPILLDQLEDYADQFATGRLRDPYLRLLVRPELHTLDRSERKRILDQCFRANHSTMVEPFPAYRRLRDIHRSLSELGTDPARCLSGEYLADLITWYHLSWTGETVRRRHELVVQLMTRGEGFSHADRMQLFELMGVVVRELLGRYRDLAQRGQIEISTTPHYHPIGPLLLDFACARESMPDAPLPEAPAYPGGRQRALWHLDSACRSHEQRFGARPTGVWPAEGALSTPFARLLAQRGVGWAASGEGMLANTLKSRGGDVSDRSAFLYRPYRVEFPGAALTCLFRDDRLSDLIGFEYKSWHGRDAANHFIGQLETILAQTPAGEEPVVCIILDGENAWEYYPYNAFYFLDDLYGELASHPSIRTMTCSEVLADPAAVALTRPLPALTTGSWVYGNLSTWIGSHDKNRAWDLLCNAKHSYDLVVASGRLTESELAAASRQLAVCEGSDWFWWFGDYNPSESVASFDRLFRDNLINLYRLLKLDAPAALNEPVSRGAVHAHTEGAMRRAA
jgi:alpha-amylase/alpha-mannosidase (GH57 family)